MRKVTEELPSLGELVIAYLPDNRWYPAMYKSVLTWKGYRYKFVNIASNGLWHDNVIGWNRIPDREETI